MKFIIRLGDACEYMDLEKWHAMELLLDQYQVKPLVAVIPYCMDDKFIQRYEKNDAFWKLAREWQRKGWDIALHGYNHRYTNYHAKGLNPINPVSEFVGLPLEEQSRRIREGVSKLKEEGLHPKYFVAPAHSFDENTLLALKNESDIRIVSDTIASKVYYDHDLWFIPQQCGEMRFLPCRIVTGCYHPNTMSKSGFVRLERFIVKHRSGISSASTVEYTQAEKSSYDKLLSKLYFVIRRKGEYE